jgi:hypothetical protein
MKAKETTAVRNQLAKKQNNICPICKSISALGQFGHLDHCHDTGLVRATLCKTCNTNEGKVKYASRYMAKATHLSKTDPIAWLKNLVAYLEHHRDNPGTLYHHSFDLVKGKQKPKKRPKRRKTK